jgi:hypothetical protein
MRLIHYSKKPIVKIYSTHSQPSLGDTWGLLGKPYGLWVSAVDIQGTEENHGWKEWCKAEEFAQDRFNYETEIILKPDAKILHLECPTDIDCFTEKYRLEDNVFKGRFSWQLDWKLIASEYQGIIIAPYQWSRRMADHTFWYYGWDCSSGCIWDADVIESFVCRETPKRMIREVEE